MTTHIDFLTIDSNRAELTRVGSDKNRCLKSSAI